jgi:hypothetical protein
MHKAAAFALIVGIGIFAAAATIPASAAHAQAADSQTAVAQNNGIGGFFQRLFRPRNFAPRQAPRQLFQRSEPQRPQRRERRSRSSPAPAPREIAKVEKSEDAKRVLVVGDFFATALAKGLALAYRENPDVVVIDATSGSSGLVRNDYYDWPAKLPGIAEEQHPDAVLVLVGGNDRQGIDTENGPYALGTDGWRTAYVGRVNALVEALRTAGKPALWVGLMPVQSSTMSRDYSSFNGIVREQLETQGIPFIDIWNGFADAEGKYVAIGPDIRGQSVQLRASDGLNFTRAGQRKLAYFVEQDLENIFGGVAPQLAAGGAGLASGEAGPQIGPMVPLDTLAAAGGETLAGASDEDSGVAATEIAERLAGEEPAPQGRADDYRWPPPEPEPEPAAAEESVPGP